MIYATAAAAVVFVAVIAAAEMTSRRKTRLAELSALPVLHRRARSLAALAAVCLMLGTLVWRIRSSDQVSSNPLDLAGQVRIGFDCLAFAFALLAFDAAKSAGLVRRLDGARFSPAVLYVLYVFVVALGAYAAVNPQLVVFRAFELAAFPLVMSVVALVYSFEECITIVKRFLYAATALIALSVALFPAEALKPQAGALPIRLQGILPNLSSNTVGTIGVILVAVAFGHRVLPGGGRAPLDRMALSVGLVLIFFSQYRTGLIALFAMAVVYAAVRFKALGLTVMALLVWPVYMALTTPAVATLWGRGEDSAQTTQLGGRTVFWERAIEVADRSPYIGTGLTSGSRFEVLAYINNGRISTVHSTWIEAYLGTGMIGTAIIALIMLQFARAGWRARARNMTPLLVAASTLVRSITGTTIELSGTFLVLFGILAAATWRVTQFDAPEPRTQKSSARPRSRPLQASTL